MSYAEHLAAQYNARITRNDIEWFVDAGGNLRLRDRPAWSSARTRELAEAAERDRQQFKHRQRYPAAGIEAGTAETEGLGSREPGPEGSRHAA